jgi:hypothetical protein
MVRMSHVIDIEQVPRLWFEQVIHSFYELANSIRTQGEAFCFRTDARCPV